MIRKMISVGVLCVAFLPTFAVQANDRQSGEPKQASAPRPPLATNSDARRFFLKLEELDHGHRLSSRTFEVLTRERQSTLIKAGSRVPITQTFESQSKSQSVQYVDVGLNIRLHYELRSDDKLDLNVDLDTSTVPPQKNTSFARTQLLAPVVRQVRFELNAVVTPDTETLLDSVEDLTSGHTYQLSVRAQSR